MGPPAFLHSLTRPNHSKNVSEAVRRLVLFNCCLVHAQKRINYHSLCNKIIHHYIMLNLKIILQISDHCQSCDFSETKSSYKGCHVPLFVERFTMSQACMLKFPRILECHNTVRICPLQRGPPAQDHPAYVTGNRRRIRWVILCLLLMRLRHTAE